jgi:hypothetical protein
VELDAERDGFGADVFEAPLTDDCRCFSTASALDLWTARILAGGPPGVSGTKESWTRNIESTLYCRRQRWLVWETLPRTVFRP